jgi:nicotinamide phosphoribosyltransferase
MKKNLLLCTDIYKLGHMEQYKPGTTKIWSYLTARKDDKIPFTVFFGLQYYLKEYLSLPITQENADEFFQYREMVLGMPASKDVQDKIQNLVKLGYLPIEIKAVPEGEVMPCKQILMSITNTIDGFGWCVGFIESLILKIWNTITVASYSRKIYLLCHKFSSETCDNPSHIPFQIHDFGYRGVSSEETAQLSGAAHLLNFLGTDTIPAIKFLKEYYNADIKSPIGLSVPASEHSVACSYGKEGELEFFRHMLEIYPTGIISMISDTFNLWNVLTNFVDELKETILNRDGKVVFRPDSGNPELIVCGNPNAELNSPEFKGALRLLDEKFGSTTNSKGYKVLNPKIGLIYGDGFYYERLERTFAKMREIGYASSNLVIGIGGLLLQQHNRDEQGFAIKATYSENCGNQMELMKDPVTDHKKKSLCGLIKLVRMDDGDGTRQYNTIDKVSWKEEEASYLSPVFKNGKLLREYSLKDIRTRLASYKV